MTYKDLSLEEFKDDVIEALANTCIDTAWDNSNFICAQCLNTLRQIISVLGVLDDQVCQEVRQEVNQILERNDF